MRMLFCVMMQYRHDSDEGPRAEMSLKILSVYPELLNSVDVHQTSHFATLHHVIYLLNKHFLQIKACLIYAPGIDCSEWKIKTRQCQVLIVGVVLALARQYLLKQLKLIM